MACGCNQPTCTTCTQTTSCNPCASTLPTCEPAVHPCYKSTLELQTNGCLPVAWCTDGCEEIVKGECVLYDGPELHVNNVHITTGLDYDTILQQLVNQIYSCCGTTTPTAPTFMSSRYLGVCCNLVANGSCNMLSYFFDHEIPTTVLATPLVTGTTIVVKRVTRSTGAPAVDIETVIPTTAFTMVFDNIAQRWKLTINDGYDCGVNTTCMTGSMQYRVYTSLASVETLIRTIFGECGDCSRVGDSTCPNLNATPDMVRCEDGIIKGKINFSGAQMSNFFISLNGVFHTIGTTWTFTTVSNAMPYEYEIDLNIPTGSVVNTLKVGYGNSKRNDVEYYRMEGCT